MKITDKWLRKRYACKEGIEWFKKNGETDIFIILNRLIKENPKWANWLVSQIVWRDKIQDKIKRKIRRLSFRVFYKLRRLFKRLLGMKTITEKQAGIWFKENGFTISKQTDIFGHYFRIDPLNDKVGQRIKWHYDDSNDCYYVKWQMWTGTENKRRLKMYPTPKRKDKVEWECETDNASFTAYYTKDAFHKAIMFIKNHSEEKFKLLRDFIEKKQLNKL